MFALADILFMKSSCSNLAYNLFTACRHIAQRLMKLMNAHDIMSYVIFVVIEMPTTTYESIVDRGFAKQKLCYAFACCVYTAKLSQCDI